MPQDGPAGVLSDRSRKKGPKEVYSTLDELQRDLDNWTSNYKKQPTHRGKCCFGKMPMQTFLDSIPLAKEKMLQQTIQTIVQVA